MNTFDSIDGLAHLRIWDGVTVQTVEGERTTLAVVDLEPGSTVPEHRHENEQLGILIRGSMRFQIDGEARDLTAGATWRILREVPHSVTAGPEGALAVECFTPTRADWADLQRLAKRPSPRLA
ncbi:MAG TPA: cupin domain-containing protein [Gaiellales bacterium]|nr:cupin domain-containing protein [Gaiellales bacterium]